MIAIVTGGSSGIGKAICKKLAEEYQVINVSRRRESKEGGVLVDTHPNIVTEICDVRDIKALQRVIEKYDADVLINNVGIMPLKGFLEQSSDDYNNIMNTNFVSAVFATQSMLKKGRGHIINIASNSGLKANPDSPIYGASKAALVSFTKSIAAEYGNIIQCNCICPGIIDTRLVEGPSLPQKEIDKIPMGRIGQPEEIAEVVFGLLKSTYINGAVITVDGGQLQGVWRWGQ